jgi:sigma-70-like protein
VRPPFDGGLVAGREGRRRFTIDPRRRLGAHGRARRFLVSDTSPADAALGVWRGLVSALQRHAVENALGEIKADDRQLLTLAYIEGRTNSDIAAMLGVSVRTVRRRLSVALAHLEEQARRSGAWISSIATAALLRFADQASALGRLAAGWRQEWPGALAVGAIAAVGIGLVGAGHDPATIGRVGLPGTAQVVGLPQAAEHLSAPRLKTVPAGPVVTRVVASRSAAEQPSSAGEVSSPKTRDAKEGCGGHPTSAPPAVPVGPRPGHPSGPPVTHPPAGGCGSG